METTIENGDILTDVDGVKCRVEIPEGTNYQDFVTLTDFRNQKDFRIPFSTLLRMVYDGNLKVVKG
jgi:hypothetical protein